MKDSQKILISIIAVAVIAAIVVGGTFAYWTWQSATNTNVTFTVAGGSATMTIDGGGNLPVDGNTNPHWAPAACANTNYGIQRKIKVTAVNDTTTPMTETIQLKINSFTKGHGTDANFNTAKASVKWALVRSDSSQHAASTWLETSGKCAATAATNSNTKGTMLAKGTFSGLSANSVITIFNKDVAEAKATASADAVTTTDYYELYIWIDPSYTGQTTVGTTVNDPLQDMTLTLSWQGSMTNTPTS